MLEVVGFRYSDYDRPFRAHPHTSEGRYQRSGSEPTQYWALHPLGPWAEFIRANYVGPPVSVDEVHQRLWAARFSFLEDEVLEVTYAWARDSGRLTPDDLVSDDFTGCQMFADWARQNYAAVIVPSAALPGTRNLVVFGTRAASPYQLEPVDRDIDVPASVAAEHARPPVNLSAFVRFRGQAHPELSEWLDGRMFAAPPQLGVPPARPSF